MTGMGTNLEAVACDLVAEHEAGQAFRPFAQARGIASLDDAYAVQGAFVRRLESRSGVRRAGYKIGLTSPRMQAMCGIDQPIAGVVLEDGVHRSGAMLDRSRYGRLGIEFEVAVRLARDLPADLAPFDRESVASAVEAVCPAVEIVDDRRADYRELDVLSLVADNSWNAGVVLGEFRSSWPDLAGVEGVVRCGGAEVDRGTGRDVLGHPFIPLAWLANHLARTGASLRAGDIVMTGSLVPTRFPTRAESYSFELTGLGSVELSIRPGA